MKEAIVQLTAFNALHNCLTIPMIKSFIFVPKIKILDFYELPSEQYKIKDGGFKAIFCNLWRQHNTLRMSQSIPISAFKLNEDLFHPYFTGVEIYTKGTIPLPIESVQFQTSQ